MKRNHNLIITSAETVCVGLVMPFNQEGIRDDPNNPFIHSVHALGQIPWVVENADTAFAQIYWNDADGASPTTPLIKKFLTTLTARSALAIEQVARQLNAALAKLNSSTSTTSSST
ncbi:hypothetical protein ABDK69_06280 [Limosilactobacillus fermentum]|uniref:hypothetical protein n=1 Tax=Limosilactobacillus fermentum TaxID=1613 RepID=UPI003F663101